MSYQARGPALAGIDGKAIRAERRHHYSTRWDSLSEAPR